MLTKFLLTVYLAGTLTTAALVKKVEKTAEFDDIPATQAAVQPLGAYEGLKYTGFVVVNQKLPIIGGQVAGINPNSAPNAAAFDPRSTVLNGPPSITPDGNTVAFTAKSFYFGCVLPEANAITSTPTSCTVTVTGRSYFKVGPKAEEIQQSFEFTPKLGALKQEMVVAKLTSFALVDQITFDVQPSGIALLTDNYNYYLHGKNL
ncbi:uncharacterized protein LTR77_002948 [Saxophila tyrrhenica]|uniref:Uncharacterized protein n=1 Tax=Saxophila tyrrhenica TaxID=1690608 RepID=A0AAV9PHQ2_9PEZI|nr:hypothetical protein LTR77_002948 [Saxophila tyrrhenica]